VIFSYSFDEEISFLISMMLLDINLCGHGPSDLVSLDKFFKKSHGCSEEVVLAIFISATMSSTMVLRTLCSLAISTRLFGAFPWHTCVDTFDDDD
jgi:hypothetical protein